MFKCMYMYEGGANKVHYKKEKEAEFEAVTGVSSHACVPWTRKPCGAVRGVVGSDEYYFKVQAACIPLFTGEI